MVRISGARMSGTAYGSIILHMTPDAAAGGPLARVRNGDCICLSVKERRPLSLPPRPARGYARLYHDQILQADRGCDFDFLRKRPTEKAGL
jgi:dihydroxy-acid dehydratase